MHTTLQPPHSTELRRHVRMRDSRTVDSLLCRFLAAFLNLQADHDRDEETRRAQAAVDERLEKRAQQDVSELFVSWCVVPSAAMCM